MPSAARQHRVRRDGRQRRQPGGRPGRQHQHRRLRERQPARSRLQPGRLDESAGRAARPTTRMVGLRSATRRCAATSRTPMPAACARRHRLVAGRLAARGEVRPQFHHVIDIVPTVLDLVGVTAPQVQRRAAVAPPWRQPALFVRRSEGPDPAAHAVLRDVLAPGDLARGLEGGVVPSPRPDLRPGRVGALQPRRRLLRMQRPGEEAPGMLQRMVAAWWGEAGKYGVLPLDDRGFPERAVRYQSNGSPRLRTRFSLYPGISSIPSGAAPLLIDRSFRIRPPARRSKPGGERPGGRREGWRPGTDRGACSSRSATSAAVSRST